MKKLLMLFSLAAALGILLWSKPSAISTGDTGLQSDRVEPPRFSDRRADANPSDVSEEPAPLPDETDAVATPKIENAVVDTAAEFAIGHAENIHVVGGALRLSESVVAGENGPVQGTFTSPEIQAAPFDFLTFTYEGAVPDESTLNLAVRVLFPRRGWSEWRDINMENISLPMALEAAAEAWQYRVSMAAESVAQSPQVENITIIPRYVAAAETGEEPGRIGDQ